MSAIGFLSVAPVREGSMADDVARAIEALDHFDVEYEMNAMGTVLEASDVDELFAAVRAAHKAVQGDRVVTFLKIDDKRTRRQSARQKVQSVEETLGRPARSGS